MITGFYSSPFRNGTLCQPLNNHLGENRGKWLTPLYFDCYGSLRRFELSVTYQPCCYIPLWGFIAAKNYSKRIQQTNRCGKYRRNGPHVRLKKEIDSPKTSPSSFPFRPVSPVRLSIQIGGSIPRSNISNKHVCACIWTSANGKLSGIHGFTAKRPRGVGIMRLLGEPRCTCVYTIGIHRDLHDRILLIAGLPRQSDTARCRHTLHALHTACCCNDARGNRLPVPGGYVK